MLCSSQLRTGFGGAYALDWTVVMRVAEVTGIVIDSLFFSLLKAFENVLIGQKKEA